MTIALEPEAASIYCQYLKIAKEDTLSPSLGVVTPGTKYMVTDLGGKNFSLYNIVIYSLYGTPISQKLILK